MSKSPVSTTRRTRRRAENLLHPSVLTLYGVMPGMLAGALVFFAVLVPLADLTQPYAPWLCVATATLAGVCAYLAYRACRVPDPFIARDFSAVHTEDEGSLSSRATSSVLWTATFAATFYIAFGLFVQSFRR